MMKNLKEVKSVYMIAIMSDIIGIEISNINLDKVINPELKSKLRNLKKATDKISKFTDDNIIGQEGVNDFDIQEAFGDMCDEIHRKIKQVVEEIFER